MLVIISGPSGVGKDTIIDALRRTSGTRPTDDRHYVVTCTTRAPPAGRGRRRDYHFVEPRRVPPDPRAARVPRGERGPRQLVRLAARPGPARRWPSGKDVILKIDVQGAQVVKEQVPEAFLIFVVPPSMEALFQRLRARATETRRRARAPPAQRGDRAGPPGRLRPRRHQRDRPGRADGRPDRRDHRRGASPAPDPPRPGLRRRRDPRLDPMAELGRETRRGRSGRSRAARHVEVAIDAAGGGGARRYTYVVPDAWPTSSPARRSSSSSGGARRSGSSSATRRRPTGSSPSRSPAGSGPTARCCRRSRSRSPRWIADHYLAPPALVAPGDAAARAARAARALAERTARRAGRRRSPRRRGPARPARTRPAADPRPRRRRRPGRRSSGGSGARRRRPRDARLDAARGGRRAALRALDPADRGRARGRLAARGAPGERAARPAARARGQLAGWPSSRRGAGDSRDGPARRRSARSPRHRRARGPRPPRPRRGRGPRAPAPAARGAAARAARRAPAGRGADRRPGRGGRVAPARDRGPATRPRSCSTASRAAARPRSMSRPSPRLERGGRRSCWCPRSPLPCRSSTACGPTSRRGSPSSTRGWATASGPTSGGGSGPATSTSSSGRGWPCSRRSPTSA